MPEPTEATDEPPWTLKDVLKNMDSKNKAMPSPIGASRKTSKKEKSTALDTSWDGFRVVRDGPDENDDQSENRFLTPLPGLPRSEPGKLLPVLPAETSSPADVGSVKAAPATQPLPQNEVVFQVPEAFDEYVVKYGDTLSGIAQKFLGSHARYREIYDANRDRMESPDRLDVGKPLRIPRVHVGASTSDKHQ
jgi:nucleoid-associated protein YgaU